MALKAINFDESRQVFLNTTSYSNNFSLVINTNNSYKLKMLENSLN